MPHSKFNDRVIKIVCLAPLGSIVSYGQVALMVGTPRAGLQVGGVLNKLDETADVPWWRVINNSGRISIKGSDFSARDQKERLEAEGVVVSNKLKIDIEKYRWRPDTSLLKSLELDEEYLAQLVLKYSL